MHNSTLEDIKNQLKLNPKLILLIVLKGRHHFLTDLKNLNLKDSDKSQCISVLLMNSYFMPKIGPDIQHKFHYVIWFDGGEFWNGEKSTKLDKLFFPDIDFMIGRFAKICSGNRIRLISMEESLVRFVSMLREKYAIEGPKSVHTECFTSKIQMKTVARTQGIPVPNFQIVSPAGLLTSQEYFSSLEQVIGFPMVLKPIHGVSGAGVIKIHDAAEMYSWLKLNCNVHMTYLAEEALKGVECVLLALVNKSKVQFFKTVLQFIKSPLGSITEGSPVAVLPLQTGSPLNERLHAFGSEIIKSLNNTRLNSIVVLRIMYLPNEDTFKFSKISCRIPNPLCCEAFEINCGVSPETVHITTQVMDVDIANCEIADPKEHFALVSYPCQLGTLAYIPNLEKFDLKSSYKLIQHISLGQRMENPSHINDVCLIIQLGNESFEDLRSDVQKLCNEFKPVVI